MTTQAGPDPTTLNSWEEAFQYPLPTVRTLSTRLRRDVDGHRARLRSLVGASYRDLLGTAERIVDMDKQIQSVETVLSDVGRRCNSSLLERSDANFLGLEKSWSETNGQDVKLRRAALLRILSSTLNVVARLVKKNGNALQASKLMILARLLYKSLSDDDDTLVVLEKYRRSISSLRNRLLSYVDRLLGRQEAQMDETVAALSAFGMLTSSAPRDVLRHFLAIRVAQLESITETSTSETILKALDLHSATFITVQSLFPKRISESLSSLAKVTLLSDQHITGIDELNLDVFGRWIPSDVRSFTPWVQQEALSGNHGRQALADYSTQARAVLLAGVRACLGAIDDANAVLEIRKKVLGAYLSISKQVRVAQFAEQIDEMRNVFVSRMRIVGEKSSKLDTLFVDLNLTTSTTNGSIWDLAAQDVDLSLGASHFRKKIVRYHRGHGVDFDTAIEPLTQMVTRIENYWQSIQAMRATKWQEYLETDIEDNEEEEEEQSYQDQLSTDDPDDVVSSLRQSTASALAGSFDRLEKSISDGPESGQAPAYIRLLRELNRQHRHIGEVIGLAEPDMSRRRDVSTKLHSQLAASAVQDTIDALASSISERQYIPLDLWDGTPKVPSQPLPVSFKFIMTLQQNMATVGNDVWSPAAVDALKTVITERLPSLLQRPFEEEKTVNGHAHANGVEEAVSTPPSIDQNSGAKNDETSDTAERLDAKSANDHAVDTSSEPQEHADNTDDPIEEKDVEKSTTQLKQNGDQQQPEPPTHLKDHIQYTQRLFDAYWLRCILHSNKNDVKLDAAIDVLKDLSMLEDGAQQRLEKNAVEYWRKTYLLFALLISSNDISRK